MVKYEGLIPTPTGLLSRLKSSEDSESWLVGFATYWKLIFNAVRRAGLTETKVKDVVQATLLTLVRTIHGSSYKQERGSFKGWLIKIRSGRRP